MMIKDEAIIVSGWSLKGLRSQVVKHDEINLDDPLTLVSCPKNKYCTAMCYSHPVLLELEQLPQPLQEDGLWNLERLKWTPFMFFLYRILRTLRPDQQTETLTIDNIHWQNINPHHHNQGHKTSTPTRIQVTLGRQARAALTLMRARLCLGRKRRTCWQKSSFFTLNICFPRSWSIIERD